MIIASGIGSGLDVEGLLSQLVAAERAPADGRLTRQETRLTAELSGFGQFKGALASFQSSLANLNNLSKFGQHTATSSSAEKVSVSASASAKAGSYDLTVTQLAKAHSLASGSYASTGDVVGEGTLTFRFGTTNYTGPDPGPESYDSFAVNPQRGVASVAIGSGNNTLAGVRDAINAAKIGVSASIVNDGSGYRLLLSSGQTGGDNSIQISVDDTGDGDPLDAGGLSALAFNADATNLSQTVAAQNALFTVNGLGISSSKNTATDVINGVTLNLKDVTSAAPVTVTVAQDRDSVKQAVGGLVAGYNSFVKTLAGLTAYDPKTGLASALQGDFSARTIGSQIRQTLTSAVAGLEASFGSLSEIGITTLADGSLKLDPARLDLALENDFGKISGLFAQVGFPSDSGISYLGASARTALGNYDVNISQLATQGKLVGAAAGAPLLIDDDNNNFSIKVNGIDSANISLTLGTYASGAALAAEIQARINGDSTLSAAGLVSTVVFNGDHFEITSNRYGSSSTLEITAADTNSAATLGLSVAAGVAGLDVAGTIGGVAAIGSGQLLKGATGSDTEGLQLLIDGGATGDRGQLAFTRGITHQLNAMISGFLESGGVLNSRTDGIQQRVDNITDKRLELDRRMEALEIRYRAQFTALDSLLSQMRTTSDFLTQQLESLPGVRSNK